jgi:hypothetical protein
MSDSEVDELREQNYVLGLQVAKLRVRFCSAQVRGMSTQCVKKHTTYCIET